MNEIIPRDDDILDSIREVYDNNREHQIIYTCKTCSYLLEKLVTPPNVKGPLMASRHHSSQGRVAKSQKKVYQVNYPGQCHTTRQKF
jgi:hypothetical protein